MQKIVRVFSALAFLGGLSAFAYLVSLPRDPQNGLLNVSPFRLISLTGILAVICISVIIFFRFKSIERVTGLIERIKGFKSGRFFAFILFTFSLTAWVAFLYREVLIAFFGEAVYARLAPLMLLGSLVSLQVGVIVLLPLFKDKKECLPESVWKMALSIMGGFVVMAIFIVITGIGFTVDNVGLNWGPAGTPLTFAQVNLVLSIGFVLSFPIYIIGSRIKDHHSRWLLILDVGIFIALWGLAVILWSNQQISPTHFSPATSAPNYEYYPYSDAAIFDRMSYHLLSGVGFSESLVRRPLYVGLVALFHTIGGVGYNGTVLVQILFLALLPSFIYLLTAKFSNRLAGFMAGGLVVLREANAIDLSGKIVTSHAKLIMSDLPATFGIVIFVYACIILFTKPKRDKWLLLIIGASLGLLALVRAQSLILVPLILLYVLIPQKKKKNVFISSAVILLGLVLVITPWAWRNWNHTGMPVLGDVGEKMLMARNYSLSPIEYPQPLSGETTADFSSRLSRDILSFVLEHPANVAFFISNHFMHSLATSAIYIAPVYSTNTPESLVSQNPFWDIWNGSLTGGSLLALLGNLAILAFGISLAQKDDKIAGWYPLLVFMIYQAGNALARTSGWRFALPVDWIILVYYCIALSYLPSKIGLLFARQSSAIIYDNQSTKPNPIYPAVFLFLFFMGISIPLAERLIPARKFDYLESKAKNALVEKNILTSDQLEQFLQQKNAVFISGIALYPRYYRPGGGIYLANMPQNLRYLHFWLINDVDTQIILPGQKPPEFFPHAATVSVIGCMNGNYMSAWAVFIQTKTGEQMVVQEATHSLICP
ncbi:MAG: glycosyltransferase family 39 protein [Chloroflexi bacterium]|nr:glycosyltransferase family 39 protein [Chloroflexota bacterium]